MLLGPSEQGAEKEGATSMQKKSSGICTEDFLSLWLNSRHEEWVCGGETPGAEHSALLRKEQLEGL